MDLLSCPKCLKNWESTPVHQRIPATLEGNDFALQMDPETTDFVCPNGHSFSAAEVIEMTPKKSSGRAKKNPKNSTDLSQNLEADSEVQSEDAGREICKEPPAPQEAPLLPDFMLHALANITPDVVELIPSGDLRVPVLLRESYVEAVQQLADENKQTVTAWLQERVDFWMENEFSFIAAQANR